MATAIFGISNGGLNLVVNLMILMLVVLWLALIVYTFLDAKRRIGDSFLVGCATLASFIPFLGTAVYAIVRPPEFLEDAHERELEIKAAELRVRQLSAASCPNCEYPVERDYLRCPQCKKRLKEPCPSCAKPVDPRWSLCPYCEEIFPERDRPRRKRSAEARRPAREERKSAPREKAERPAAERAERPKAERTERPNAERPKPEAATETSEPKRQQRSTSREPDPDPRQA